MQQLPGGSPPRCAKDPRLRHTERVESLQYPETLKIEFENQCLLLYPLFLTPRISNNQEFVISSSALLKTLALFSCIYSE